MSDPPYWPPPPGSAPPPDTVAPVASGSERQPSSAGPTRADPEKIGFWLPLAGAAAMALGVFLPEASASSFAQVAHNTLIQNGDGLVFLGLALFQVAWSFQILELHRFAWGPTISGVLGLAYALYLGTSADALRLCPVNTQLFGSRCEQASPGVGIYLVGLGGLLMLAGGLQARRAPGG